MPMTEEIKAAEKAFRDVMLGGIPFLLKQNDTAFLSIVCSLAAIDALSGYRYRTDKVGERYESFISEYFPAAYKPHADKLYLLRCRMLHNFSPAYFSLTHSRPDLHLRPSPAPDFWISDNVLFDDLKDAASKFFAEVHTDEKRQGDMSSRLADLNRGGAIFTHG